MEDTNDFEDYFRDQIFTSDIPPYKPPEYADLSEEDFHSCVDCGDRYILETSLNIHLTRKSVEITYFCQQCDQSLQFHNRCNLLAHLRLHPQSNRKNLPIRIRPLPWNNGESDMILISDNAIAGTVGGCSSKSASVLNIGEKLSVQVRNNSGIIQKVGELQKVDIGKIGELKTATVEAEKSPAVNKLVTCRECGVDVDNIKLHFLGDNKPFNPKIRCDCCDQILPTNCNLKAHLRIHFKKFPFICPDCMKEFAFFELFMVHLRYFCFHLDKCSRFKCQACPGIFPSLTSLEVHLATRHVKPVYKCSACPRAFFELKLLSEHKIQNHGDIKVPTKFFEQCQLCPQKLLTKSCLFFHIHEHVMNKNVCFYSYRCANCKFVTDFKLKFASHRLTCPPSDKDPSAHALAKLSKTNLMAGDVTIPQKPIVVCLPDCSNSRNSTSVSDQLQDKNIGGEINNASNPRHGHPANKHVIFLNNNVDKMQDASPKRLYKACSWYPNKCLMCKNELTHGTAYARNNCPINYEGCDKWKSKPQNIKSLFFNQGSYRIKTSNRKNCMAFNAPNKSESSFISSTYLCHICKHSIQMNHILIQKHFRQQHPHIELVSLYPILHRLNLPKMKTPLEKLRFTIKNSRYSEAVSNVNRNSANYRKDSSNLRLRVLLNQNRNNGIVKWLYCSKCKFKTKNRKTLKKHLNSHKSPFQCTECGLKFVVEPSLKKHLILHHKNVETEDSTIKDVNQVHKENHLDARSSEDDLHCKVCDKSFENAVDLQKHFRIHGMAFLMLNKDEKVWRKV